MDFYSLWEIRGKLSAKLLETPSSVDDMYHHSAPSSLRVFVLKSFVLNIQNSKISQLSASKAKLD